LPVRVTHSSKPACGKTASAHEAPVGFAAETRAARAIFFISSSSIHNRFVQAFSLNESFSKTPFSRLEAIAQVVHSLP
jgi:hypothetical protein